MQPGPMQPHRETEGKPRRQVLAWAFYDWGNSAFATTVMAGFFPIVFKEYFSAGVEAAQSTARLGFANSAAGLAVAVAAPFLGAVADRASSKKLFLACFAATGVLSTVGLSLVGMGSWVLACTLYGLGLAGFLGGNVFYDSLLKRICSEGETDRVSSLGYGLGYLGGGLLFALNVWMLSSPSSFRMAGALDAARFSFVAVGVWWAVFTVPLLAFVREPALPGVRISDAITGGLAMLRSTMREIARLRTLLLFLTAYWLYIDAVDTIIVMAVDYGLSLGFDRTDLVSALLLVQFIGFPCAIAFGRLGGVVGTKRAIILALCVYLFVTLWGAFIETRGEFYLMAALIGTVQGGVQALSRSFYARLVPTGKEAEFFGFYNMIGKFASIVGPALVALTVLLARAAGAPGHTAPRFSIASIALLFIAGGAVLLLVDEERGSRERGILEA